MGSRCLNITMRASSSNAAMVTWVFWQLIDGDGKHFTLCASAACGAHDVVRSWGAHLEDLYDLRAYYHRELVVPWATPALNGDDELELMSHKAMELRIDAIRYTQAAATRIPSASALERFSLASVCPQLKVMEGNRQWQHHFGRFNTMARGGHCRAQGLWQKRTPTIQRVWAAVVGSMARLGPDSVVLDVACGCGEQQSCNLLSRRHGYPLRTISRRTR